MMIKKLAVVLPITVVVLITWLLIGITNANIVANGFWEIAIWGFFVWLIIGLAIGIYVCLGIVILAILSAEE